MKTARDTLEAARRFEVPKNNHKILVLLGVIALRQEDRIVAQDAFIAAINAADSMLVQCDQHYEALDSKGLALCGLTLCMAENRIQAATSAFQTARAINQHVGTVGRILRMFDALVATDPTGSMAAVRVAVRGSSGLNA